MIEMVTEINLRYNVLISVYPVSDEDYTTHKCAKRRYSSMKEIKSLVERAKKYLRIRSYYDCTSPNRSISDFAFLVQIPRHARNFGCARNVVRHLPEGAIKDVKQVNRNI